MLKLITYSLFGYNKERNKDCFDFHSYLRGLMINIRLQRLLFPSWRIRLYLDQSTYDGYKRLFELLSQDIHANLIDIEICEDAELTKAMLWRIKPLYDGKVERFICRDLASPLTYRDAQAVKDWENTQKVAHAITDSVSHNLPMLGGMIGFTKYASDFIKAANWDELVNRGGGYKVKGADQTFLTNQIYPKVANGGSSSIMQHYVLGMHNTFLDGYSNKIPDIDLELGEGMKGSNDICGHIGAAGWYETALFKFLRGYEFPDIVEIEKLHPNIFYWNTDGSN